jgi:maleylacetoacetate isomerase
LWVAMCQGPAEIPFRYAKSLRECSCNPANIIFIGRAGIPYEYKAINILKGEQFTEEFTKLNPLQMVPVLDIDSVKLVDSVAILQYLEEKFPDRRPLLPKDLVQRAHIHQVVYLISANIQPAQNLQILTVIEAKLGSTERLKWAQGIIEKGFTALEQILEKTAGKYCFGDTVTLADVVLVPQVATANRYQVDMAPYPTIQRIVEALYELPEVEASMPANQPDAPKS